LNVSDVSIRDSDFSALIGARGDGRVVRAVRGNRRPDLAPRAGSSTTVRAQVRWTSWISFGGSSASPLVDVTAGNNWFYSGTHGYSPGAGLGVLNVANLVAAVRHESHR